MRTIAPLHIAAVQQFCRNRMSVWEYVDQLHTSNPYLYRLIETYFSFFEHIDFETTILPELVVPVLWLIEPPVLESQDLCVSVNDQVISHFGQELIDSNSYFYDYLSSKLQLLKMQVEFDDNFDVAVYYTLAFVYVCEQARKKRQGQDARRVINQPASARSTEPGQENSNVVQLFPSRKKVGSE